MKLTSAIKNFFKGLLWIGILPSLVGTGFYISGGPFWASGLSSLALEILVVYLVVVIYRTQLVEKTKQAELDKIGNLSAILNCAVCAQPNLITFIPDQQERVEFQCEKCQKQNVVAMQFTVALVTNPVDKLTLPKEVDKVPNAFAE